MVDGLEFRNDLREQLVFLFWVFVGFLFGQEGKINLIQELAKQFLGFLNQKCDQHVYVNEEVTESGLGFPGNAFSFSKIAYERVNKHIAPPMFSYADLVLNDKTAGDKGVKN